MTTAHLQLGKRRWPALGLVLAFAAPLGAQPARDVVTDRLAVTAVEIPVQVLRRGEPLRGLTAADFEVYDRGVRQQIIDFDVLDLTDSPPQMIQSTAGLPLQSNSIGPSSGSAE